ncbi:MAG: FAD-binding oxidoreductase [Nannocystaceae bacterium]
MSTQLVPAPLGDGDLISGWGRHPWHRARIRTTERLAEATLNAPLSRGLGRAYGDSALPVVGEQRTLVDTTQANRVLAFDGSTGLLRAEAGLSLGSLRRFFLPRGWMSPVRPGTRHVTLGGMVAADVHGKEHHLAGCIGAHVRSLTMRTGDGEIRDVSPDSHPDLFFATLGGMGLTGHILDVELALERVPSPWIYQETERRENLASLIEGLHEASTNWPMTVAWMDTTARGASSGRGIVMRGRWADASEAPSHYPNPHHAVAVPVRFPNGLANPFTFGILNTLLYRRHGSQTRRAVQNPDKWFWPLDRLDHWNRVYGSRGFTQFQCVLPRSAELFRELLDRFRDAHGCSFVTVFKDCGPAGKGMLSFPQTGTSLALDLPISQHTPKIVRELNAIVTANGGRIYLAKDAFTTAKEFETMYPRLAEWNRIRTKYDPDGRLISAQSRRLLGD